jgi:hypothetical protein
MEGADKCTHLSAIAVGPRTIVMRRVSSTRVLSFSTVIVSPTLISSLNLVPVPITDVPAHDPGGVMVRGQRPRLLRHRPEVRICPEPGPTVGSLISAPAMYSVASCLLFFFFLIFLRRTLSGVSGEFVASKTSGARTCRP